MNNLIASFSCFQSFYSIFYQIEFFTEVSLNGCGVCGGFGGFNGSVKGVLSRIANEISDGGFGDSKDTVDGSKANWGGASVGTKLSTCSYT